MPPLGTKKTADTPTRKPQKPLHRRAYLFENINQRPGLSFPKASFIGPVTDLEESKEIRNYVQKLVGKPQYVSPKGPELTEGPLTNLVQHMTGTMLIRHILGLPVSEEQQMAVAQAFTEHLFAMKPEWFRAIFYGIRDARRHFVHLYPGKPGDLSGVAKEIQIFNIAEVSYYSVQYGPVVNFDFRRNWTPADVENVFSSVFVVKQAICELDYRAQHYKMFPDSYVVKEGCRPLARYDEPRDFTSARKFLESDRPRFTIPPRN